MPWEIDNQSDGEQDPNEIAEDLKAADQYLAITSREGADDTAGCIYTKGDFFSLGVMLAGYFDLNPHLYTMMMAIKNAESTFQQLVKEHGEDNAGEIVRTGLTVIRDHLERKAQEDDSSPATHHTMDEILAELGLDK